MTLRHQDPFVDPTLRLDDSINPFVKLIKDPENGLPISYGPILKSRAGQWRQIFAEQQCQTNKLVLEIGCHLGKTINEMASAHPETGFIGVDITFKRVVASAQKAVAGKRKNIHTMLLNAKVIDRVFSPGELDGMVIFFPDPWVKKKRQQKNRLITDEFCRSFVPLMKEGGFVWFKTDRKDYLDHGTACFEWAGLERVDTAPDKLLTESYPTTFELGFTRREIPTWSVMLRRPILQ